MPSKAKTVPADKEPIGDDRIKDVWVDNFLQELEQVAALVDQYNYISMVSQTHSLITHSRCNNQHKMAYIYQ